MEARIATPISHLFAEIQQAKEILDNSDCLETRERTIDSTLPSQALLHFDLNIMLYWSEATYQYILDAINARPCLELISFHMATSCDAPQLKNRIFIPGGNKYNRPEMYSQAREHIQWLREVLPAGAQIAVENNNYYPSEAYEHIAEPEFISRIVHDNDIRFLFDLAHAKVSAHNLNRSYTDYQNELPMEKVIQLHICRHDVTKDGMAYDAHENPDEDILNESVQLGLKFPVKYYTVEYYKDMLKLIGTLKELRNKLRDVA